MDISVIALLVACSLEVQAQGRDDAIIEFYDGSTVEVTDAFLSLGTCGPQRYSVWFENAVRQIDPGDIPDITVRAGMRSFTVSRVSDIDAAQCSPRPAQGPTPGRQFGCAIARPPRPSGRLIRPPAVRAISWPSHSTIR